MTSVTTNVTKVFLSTLKQASSIVITAASRAVQRKKSLGKKKTARGATPPPYAARNPFTRNPPHVRTVLQSQGKPLNGSRDGVSAKRP